MQNRTFILTLVVVVAVFLGVTMAVQQANSPVMRRLVQQQDEVLTLQRKIERRLSGGEEAAGQPQNIEGRLASLETKVDSLVKIFSNLQAGAQRPAGPPPEEYTKQYKIDIGNSPVKGKKEAPITIVEFVDFQCPFCARFHPVLNDVIKEYPDKVNYILKNFPLGFHPQAKPAAKAALAAGEQGKYWEMAELLLQNGSALSDQKYEELAKQIGLNVDQFKKDLQGKDAQYEKIIQDDLQLGQSVDVRGTPTFYLDGRKTTARDLATYKQQIDDILSGKKQ